MVLTVPTPSDENHLRSPAAAAGKPSVKIQSAGTSKGPSWLLLTSVNSAFGSWLVDLRGMMR